MLLQSPLSSPTLFCSFGMGCAQAAEVAEAVSLASRLGFGDRELVPQAYPLRAGRRDG